MLPDFPIEVKLRLSKRFPPGISVVKFGRYQLQVIPSVLHTGSEAILSFIDNYEHPERGGSYPEEEANMVAKLISIVWDSHVKPAGLRVNNVDIPSSEGRDAEAYPQFFGVFDPTTVENYLEKVLSLEEDLARQYIRACKTYSFACEFIPSDVTFAFILLVVSVECMSSQDSVIPFDELNPDKKSCERYCRFITSYYPDNFKSKDEQDTELFIELLKTVYYSHRSGFVHAGKEVSLASIMADKGNSSYFKHAIGEKEIKTPGIGWFAKVIRGSLLGYLESIGSHESYDLSLLSRLAHEKSGLTVKANKALIQHQVVTFGDIEYR